MRLAKGIDEANRKLVEADLCEAGSADVTGELEKDVEGLRSIHDEKCGERDYISEGMVADGEVIANLNAGLEHLGRRKVDVTARIAKDQAEVDSVDRPPYSDRRGNGCSNKGNRFVSSAKG